MLEKVFNVKIPVSKSYASTNATHEFAGLVESITITFIPGI